MRRFLIPFLASLLPLSLVGVIVAADIKVAENPVPNDSYAEVVLEGAGKGDNVAWDVYPEPVKMNDLGDGRLFFSGPCGTTYKVLADVVNFDTKTRKRYRATVTIGQCNKPQPVPPDPHPEPNPHPNPQPQPIGTPKRFVVVEDTAKAGAWRGDVLGSSKVAAWYKAAGMSHRLISINGDGEDPAATKYRQLAAGKVLPYLWILDAAGKVLKDQACPTDPDKFVAAFDLHQGKRSLGAILAKPKLKWVKFGETPKTPLIPRDQWKEVDLSTFLPAVFDQDGVGQCASSASCTVHEACQAQAGLVNVHLSAGDLYSRVNGGRDQGSFPEDNLDELIQNGVAPASMVPYVWNGRRYTDAKTVAARKPNRIIEAYLCDSFDAMASALQQGFFIEEAIRWYDSYTPGSDGWLPAPRGSFGGHALAGYGLAKKGNTWGIRTRNSWSASWGLAGNCIIPETAFSFEFGAVWACRSVYQTKTDFPLPSAMLRKPEIDPFKNVTSFVLVP